MTESIEVGWELDGVEMSGTALRPDGEGPFPAVVLVAGSGPTDRDWCSPLLPGRNGSGRLLAEVLADAGIASLRYDKRASGPHAAEHARRLAGRLSMASHLDELVAAVAALVAMPWVDRKRLAGIGSSEGALHVLHHLAGPQEHPFRAAVLLAPPGRPVGQVLLSQLRLQAAQAPGGAAIMPLVERAAQHYSAGLPMDLDPALPEGVRLVLSSFENPVNLPLARELWRESAADLLGRVEVPMLVLIGGRDVQVDVHLDGDPLRAAAAGDPLVAFAFPPNADHVLKEDLREPAEVAAAPGNGYNAPGTRLDPESVAILLDWLREHLVAAGPPGGAAPR